MSDVDLPPDFVFLRNMKSIIDEYLSYQYSFLMSFWNNKLHCFSADDPGRANRVNLTSTCFCILSLMNSESKDLFFQKISQDDYLTDLDPQEKLAHTIMNAEWKSGSELRSVILLPKTQWDVLKRSLAIPGWGQQYSGYRGKGTLITILQLATIGGAVATSLNARSAWSNYDDTETAYNSAGLWSDFDTLYADLEDKHEKASSAATLQMITIGAAAAVYLYNVIDALMIEPKIDVKQDLGSFKIEPYIRKEQAGIYASVRF